MVSDEIKKNHRFCQVKKSISLLRECLYPKPLIPLPKPIEWGRRFESVTVDRYTAYKKSQGCNISVCKCGFVIHPRFGWLGASLDRVVVDMSCVCHHGLLEIKCPYSKRDETPEAACQDVHFFCALENSEVMLKQSHPYFHQVQLQLYVASDSAAWCDFCIYTCKGISVERIFPDQQWQEGAIPQLEKYFHNFMSPEIVLCKYKPSYYL